MPTRHIFAAGGGSFGSSVNPRMTRRMLEVTGRQDGSTVLLIPTASGDALERIHSFFTECETLGSKPTCLPLFHSQTWTANPEELIAQADLIWIGGGSTRNMLLLWDAWGIEPMLRRAYDRGKVIGGVSAGAICWFEEGNTDSLGPGLGAMKCLGWLPGSCTPHFDEEPMRKPMLASQLASGTLKAGIAIDGHCTVHFENERVTEVIADRPGVNAYRVDAKSVEPLFACV